MDITLGELLEHDSAVIRNEAKLILAALDSWEEEQRLAFWQAAGDIRVIKQGGLPETREV